MAHRRGLAFASGLGRHHRPPSHPLRTPARLPLGLQLVRRNVDALHPDLSRSWDEVRFFDPTIPKRSPNLADEEHPPGLSGIRGQSPRTMSRISRNRRYRPRTRPSRDLFDNTVLTPALFRPFETASISRLLHHKFLGGHGVHIGGPLSIAALSVGCELQPSGRVHRSEMRTTAWCSPKPWPP